MTASVVAPQRPSAALASAKLGDDGPDVLLLHGFGADMMSWGLIAPTLAETCRVHLVDLPGHGGSTADGRGVGGPDAIAAAILAHLDQQQITRAHLVGHSLGGLIAIRLAQLAPDRAASTAVIASAGFGTQIDADFVEGLVTAKTAPAMRLVLERMVFSRRVVNDAMVSSVLDHRCRPGAPDALAAIAATMIGGGAQIARVTGASPAGLAIWGEADAVIPVAHAALASRGQVSVLERCGHCPHLERSGAVLRALEQFIGAAEPH